MNLLAVVPETAPVRVTVGGYLAHDCPHVTEHDQGSVSIAWTCNGSTLELHSLREYLASFEGVPVSHEQITEQIRSDLAAIDGLADVTVSTSWNTAGLGVCVGAP
jgi:NADPH-dependent 7-cyano-7-deazaguanine reductase QueF